MTSYQGIISGLSMKLKAPEEFRSGPLPKADQKDLEIKQLPLIGSLKHL